MSGAEPAGSSFSSEPIAAGAKAATSMTESDGIYEGRRGPTATLPRSRQNRNTASIAAELHTEYKFWQVE